MMIYTDGPRLGNTPSIEQLWADNLTHNISLMTGAAKIVSICAVIVVTLWFLGRLLSPKGGRLGHIVMLWLQAKERELALRAGKTPPDTGPSGL